MKCNLISSLCLLIVCYSNGKEEKAKKKLQIIDRGKMHFSRLEVIHHDFNEDRLCSLKKALVRNQEFMKTTLTPYVILMTKFLQMYIATMY